MSKRKRISALFVLSISILFTSCADRDNNSSEKANVAGQKPRAGIPKTDDIELRRVFAQEVRQLLKNGDYDRLESMEAELRESKSRFPGGDWKLERFYNSIQKPEARSLEQHLGDMRQWVSAKPASVLAQVSVADAMVGLAWEKRGGGFANTVKGESWQPFETGLAEAEQFLVKIRPEDRKKCLNWYLVMDTIARGASWPLEKYNTLFEDAISQEPLFTRFYQNKAIYLLPRWYGAPGDWEKFADEAEAKIGGEEGKIMYTAICWIVQRHYSGSEFFEQNNVQWPRIKEGWILMEKHYGPSYRYLNAYLLMSAYAVDRLTARNLVRRVGDHWEPDFWNSKDQFEKWREWIDPPENPIARSPST